MRQAQAALVIGSEFDQHGPQRDECTGSSSHPFFPSAFTPI
jgi:hypothetical protein